MNSEEMEEQREKERLSAIPVPEHIENLLYMVQEKFRKAVDARRNQEAEWQECVMMRNSDHWSLTGPDGTILRPAPNRLNRPCSVENYVWALMESWKNHLYKPFSWVDRPEQEGDEEAAKQMSQVKSHVLKISNWDSEQRLFLDNLVWLGTGALYCPWDDTLEGGAGPSKWEGDFHLQALNVAFLYPDPNCRENIQNGYHLHIAQWVSRELIEEQYPEWAHLVRGGSTDGFHSNDVLLRHRGYKTAPIITSDDDDKALLVLTMYKGRPKYLGPDEKDLGKGLHLVWWTANDAPVYLAHKNYAYYEPGKPVEFPVWLVTKNRIEGSPWGRSEALILKDVQIAANKAAEQIMESHAMQAQGRTYMEPNAVDGPQAAWLQDNGTLAGIHAMVKNVDRIKHVPGQGVPSSLQGEPGRLQGLMQKMSGMFDVIQGDTPSNVEAYRALALLSKNAQVRLREAEALIKDALRQVGNWLNMMIPRFYTQERAYQIADHDDPTKMIYGLYRPDAITRIHWKTMWEDKMPGDVEPYEASLDEMFAEVPENERPFEVFNAKFDADVKVTDEDPYDRYYYMETAMKLYDQGKIPDEVFYYVVEHGRFPHTQSLLRQIKEHQMAQMMQQPGGVPLPPSNSGMPTPPGNVPPELMAAMAEGGVSV